MADESKLPAETGETGVAESGKKDKKEKKPKKDGRTPDGADDEEEGGALSVILVTVVIIMIWLAILALLIKLDVGGFGSGVLTPVLKNVPVVNRILPGYSRGGFAAGGTVSEDGVMTAGYDDLEDAVERIKELEALLADAQKASNDSGKTIQELQAEIARLQTFEDNQVAFERIKDEFYNEVVFSDRAPDISEYRKFYEEIDPTNAQILYKQVVQKEEVDNETQEYAKAYSSMKAKEAAGIFDTMTGDLQLVAKILNAMGTDARGSILGAMDPEIAARVTEIMEPQGSVSAAPAGGGSLITPGGTVSGNEY